MQHTHTYKRGDLMDRYTKIVFSIVALVIVIEKVTQLTQMGNVKKVTLCTALDDCGVGTWPNLH